MPGLRGQIGWPWNLPNLAAQKRASANASSDRHALASHDRVVHRIVWISVWIARVCSTATDPSAIHIDDIDPASFASVRAETLQSLASVN